jgi:hypothetical protein
MLWVIRTTDGTFLRDKGDEGVVAGESVVAVDRAPDMRLERYDATASSGRRVATTNERTAFDTTRVEAVGSDNANQPMIKAFILFYLRDKLGRNPTGAERTAARDAFVQAYKDVG